MLVLFTYERLLNTAATNLFLILVHFVQKTWAQMELLAKLSLEVNILYMYCARYLGHEVKCLMLLVFVPGCLVDLKPVSHSKAGWTVGFKRPT